MGIIYKNGIPYGNQPSIDATLTHQGEAADAKAVGDEISDVRNALSHKADVIYDTASGDIASFPDGADGLPVKDLTVAIEPVQDLHGYENPWPAGGGKNKYSNSKDISVSGGPNTQTLDAVIPAGTYTISAKVTTETQSHTARISFRDSSGSGIATANLAVGSARTSASVILSEAAYRIYFYAGADSTVSGNTTYSDVLVEEGSTASATYIPYSNICPISGWTGCNISHSGADTSDPTVISISWQSEAGTVYGGTLDVTSGVLTVTMASVDLGTLEWTYIQTGYMQSLSLSWTIKTVATRTQRLYCSIYSDVTDGRSYADVPDKSIYNVDVSPYLICVKDSSYTDADIFTTAMSGVQLVYELATPQTYQLTPTEVTTLLGQNNIWTDTGDSTVEYPADTKLYIDKKLAALVAALS